MTRKRSILILFAGYGEGHRQAATALAQAFKERRIRVDVVDFMEMVHPIINSLTQFGYRSSVKHAPNLYGLFYKQTDKILPNSHLQQRVRQIGARKLQKYIRSTGPAAVINTFPLSAGALSSLRRQRQTDVMAVTVITDHTVHSQWVHDFTDHYFVGSSRVKENLLHKGISSEQIEVSGIPIRKCFHQFYDRTHLKEALGLDNRPTAVIMGGWHGVFNASLCEQLVYQENVQFLFVCGGDRQLFHRILPLQMRFPDRVHVFGYVSNIAELMSVSDFVLSKAGGLTTSEALAMGLPMLLYRPIPGQEEQNAQYLIDEGVACLARDQEQLLEQFAHLSCDHRLRSEMKQQANNIQPGNAASTICESVLNHIAERVPSQFHSIKEDVQKALQAPV